MKHPWTRSEAWGKGTAAVFGGFLAFLGFTLGLPILFSRAALPLEPALAAVTIAGFPLWMTLMVWAILARSGARAWARVGAVSGLFWLLVLGGMAWPH